MRIARALLLGLSAAGVVALTIALRNGAMPLGVAGEWTWPRSPLPPSAPDVLLAATAVAAYAGFAGLGMARLRGASTGREARWVAGLAVAGLAVQMAILSGAPPAMGLARWVTLALKGSNGYYHLARSPEMADPWRFWAEYPRWIRDQDALHIGTHPPGLPLAWRGILGVMDAHPDLARGLARSVPASVDEGFRTLLGPMPPSDRAAVVAVAALTMLACVLTVVPLYVLARAGLSAPDAWACATLWPLVPSAVMFHPTADTAFPLLATAALALVAGGGWRRAASAGVVLGLGMQATLAFLAIGLAAAIVALGRPGCLRERASRIAAIGAGFLAFTLAIWAVSGANPWVIWWRNQANHGRFYQEFPRSYRAWVVANPIELAVSVGLPSAFLAAVGYAARSAPRGAWAGLIVLAILNLSGKNLSEVARLWLPLMPAILVAAGAGIGRLGAGPWALAACAGLVGCETLALQSTIQVVYPGLG